MSLRDLTRFAHSSRFAHIPRDADPLGLRPPGDALVTTAEAAVAPDTSPGTRAPLSMPLQSALDEATRCIQCGFCLPACPTYKVFGEEKHSPRGRIQLVKAWAEGKTEPDAGLLTALDLCLDCRACEVACPIDVQYGRILSGARDELATRATNPKTSTVGERVRGFFFRLLLRHVVTQPRRVRFATRVTHWVLHTRFGVRLQQQLADRPNLWLSASLTFAAALPAPASASAPHVPDRVPAQDAAPDAPAHAAAQEVCDTTRQRTPAPTPTASLFLGCAQEGMFPETNRSTAALLRKAGYDLRIPATQSCCGALHRHHGDKPFARTLMLRNLHAFGAFDQSRDDPIVMNAGGCMAWITEAAELFESDSDEYRAAQRMASRVRDISEVAFMNVNRVTGTTGDTELIEEIEGTGATKLVEGIAATKSRTPLRVMYQPSCHLMNVCHISNEPLAALQHLTHGHVQLPPDGGSCCGSAGIYNALHPADSRTVLDAKMQGIAEVRPDVIVTSNPGCQLQMAAGVRAWGLDDEVEVMQFADFAARAVADRKSCSGNG